jgi:hypothetical protein
MHEDLSRVLIQKELRAKVDIVVPIMRRRVRMSATNVFERVAFLGIVLTRQSYLNHNSLSRPGLDLYLLGLITNQNSVIWESRALPPRHLIPDT